MKIKFAYIDYGLYLSAMKRELTKGDVYVVVDTPKKAKKLKKLLEMFKEPIFNPPNHTWSSHNGSEYGWAYGFPDGQWQGFNTKSSIHNGKQFKKVSIKKLKQILAKEHLKESDWIIAKSLEDSYECLVKIDRIEYNRIIGYYSIMSEMKKLSDYIGVFGFVHFKRYATPEEISLLEPIKDSDIAIIEALHDVLLDNHKYDFNSKLLTDARELCKKLHNIVGD